MSIPSLTPPLSYFLSDQYTLPESKSNIIIYYVNQPAYSILLPSDWYVVRRSDNGDPIPLNWNTWRQTIRDESNVKVDDINSCETKEQLVIYCNSPAFFEWSSPPSV